jgi:DNA-binding IscR family transcriptional regulator
VRDVTATSVDLLKNGGGSVTVAAIAERLNLPLLVVQKVMHAEKR